MLSKKNLVRILINTAIGVFLVFLWSRSVDLSQVWGKISQTNFLTVLPFVFFFVVGNIMRSLRLKILLEDFKIPLKNLMALNYFAQLLSFLIPLRLGEVTKGVYLSSNHNIQFSKSLVWILLDRFLDFWVVLVMGLVLLMIIPTQLPDNLRSFLPFVVVMLTLGSVFVIYFPGLAKNTAKALSRLLIFGTPKGLFIRFTGFMIDTAGFIKRGPGDSVLVLVFTFIATIADALALYALFVSVLNIPVDVLRIILGSVFSALTFLVPAAPGYVGSIQAYYVAIFGVGLGFDTVSVSAVAVLMNILTLVCILIFGVFSLYFLKFDMGLVWRTFKKEK